MMKKIISLAIIILLTFFVIAYPEGDEDLITWNKTVQVSTTGNNLAMNVAHDSQNNTYVIGYADNLLSATSGADWMLKKFYNNGTEDTANWNLTFGSNPGGSIPYDIAIDSNGFIYIVGGAVNLTNATSSADWWVKRFNTSGSENTTHWNKTFNGFFNPQGKGGLDLAYAVAIDSQDSVYVVGQTENLTNLTSGEDWLLKKFYTNGTEDITNWNKTYSGGNDKGTDYAYRVAIDSNDFIYVAGHGSNLTNGTSNYDWWIKKFNRTGTENTTQWNKTFNGIFTDGIGSQDYINGIAVDSDNSVYVAGYQTIDEGTFDYDWWIKKFYSNGTEDLTNWNKSFDWESGSDIADAIAIDVDDGIYIAGDIASNWVIKKFNKSGTENTTYWNKTIPVLSDVGVPSAVTTTGNNVTVVGFTGLDDNFFVPYWWIKRFTADTTNPVVSTVSSNGTRYANHNAPFNVTVAEHITRVDTVTFQISNGTNPFNLTASNNSGNWNQNINVSTIVEGTHNVTIFANDTAGNLNRNKIITFVVDRTAPTISLTKSSDSTSTTLKITITTSNDAETCTTSRGSVSGSGASQTITASSLNPDHTYSFEVTCQDDVGNSNSVSQSFKTDGVNGGGSAGGSSGGGGGSSGSSSSGSTTTSESDASSTTNPPGGSGSGSSTAQGEQGTAQGTQAGSDSSESATESGQEALAGQAVSDEFAGKSGRIYLWIVLSMIALVAGGAYYFTRRK